MKQQERESVFFAQTQNLRHLHKVRKQLNRSLNSVLRSGNEHLISIYTPLLVLLYASWLETSFSKLVHTPHGFSLFEIAHIKRRQSSHGIAEAWKKCVDFGIRKLTKGKSKSNFGPNAKKKLHQIIDRYVSDPATLRNRIAHGQWLIVLNSGNTNVNRDITQQINELEAVKINKWFEVAEHLSYIVEALIESPDKAFRRDYWGEMAELDAFLERSKSWTFESKISKLKKKTSFRETWET